MNHGFLDAGGRNNNHKKKTTTGTCLTLGSDGILNDATPCVDVAIKDVSPSVVEETIAMECLMVNIPDVGPNPPLPTQEANATTGNTPAKPSYVTATGKTSGKKVNVRTLYKPRGNKIDVVILKDFIRAVSERFANTAYDENLLQEDVCIVPVWVKLHGVPVTAFSEDGLSVIATKLGNHLMLNSYIFDMCMQSWGRSSYARVMIELRVDEELKDSIVVAMSTITREGHYTCVGEKKTVMKPSQTPQGFLVCPKIGFKSYKEYIPVLKKPTSSSSGNKKKGVEPIIEVSNSNPFDALNSVDNDGEFGTNYSNTPISEKIDKIERLICEGKLRLLDNDGNPQVSMGIVENDSEVEVVYDETTNLGISTSGKDGSDKGYGTNSLLEQWRDSYLDKDDYDPMMMICTRIMICPSNFSLFMMILISRRIGQGGCAPLRSQGVASLAGSKGSAPCEESKDPQVVSDPYEELCLRRHFFYTQDLLFCFNGITQFPNCFCCQNNEFDLWKMRIEQYFLMTEHSLWEVILNGDSPATTRVVDGVHQPLKFNSHKDTKTLMEAIEKRFGGNTETKKVQKTLLKQQYENLSGSSTKSLDQIHDRLQKLINQLEILRVPLSQEDINLNTSEPVSVAASVSAVIAKMPVSFLPNVNSLSNACELDDFFRGQEGILKPIDLLPWVLICPKWSVTTATGRDTLQGSVEEDPTNYALMDFSSLSSSSDNEVVSCSKACTKAYAKLQSHYDKLTADFRKSQFDVILYQTSLESVEARLLVYKQNEYVFEEDIKLLKLEVQQRDNALVSLRQTLEKAELKRDDLKLNDESLPPSPIYDRYQSGNGYHDVPPPYTRTFMPPKPDLVFNNAPNDVETDHPAFAVKFSPTNPDQDLSLTNRHSAPIIKDWHVKTSISAATPKPTSPKPTSNGKHRNRKACFVCKSLDHLIKDCDYHEKKIAQPTARNHAHRGNHKQYALMTHQNPQRHVVPTAVLTQSKLVPIHVVPINAVRPVSHVVPKLKVTRPTQYKPIVTKPNLPTRSHITRSPSPKASNSPPRVTAVQALVVNAAQGMQGKWEWRPKCPILDHGNPQHALKDKGVIDSRCSRHMTKNMSYLSDFKELNGGYVAFGENPKGGKIFENGKIKTRKLDFDDVYFVKELKFNLFSVS
nr:hypothetical protein [Tanacetum cinerariifolium]